MRAAYKNNIVTRIAHLRTYNNSRKNSYVLSLKNYIYKKMIIKYSTKVIGVSFAVLKNLFNKNLINKEKFIVIYNGFDFCKIKKSSELKALKDFELRSSTEINIVHIGRFTTAKNHVKVLSVFREILKYTDAHLILVGDGDQKIKDSVLKYIEENNIAEKVTFVGEVNNVFPYLKLADLFLFPSLWEGMPGVLLEASYVQKPIVASSIDPCLELSANLPNVFTLPLEKSDQDWAQLAIRVLEKSNKGEIIYRELIGSDYDINNSTKKLEKQWATKI